MQDEKSTATHPPEFQMVNNFELRAGLHFFALNSFKLENKNLYIIIGNKYITLSSQEAL
jgi:hypothetical protein